MVRDVAEYMAVLKGVAVEELAQVTTDNFCPSVSHRRFPPSIHPLNEFLKLVING